MTENQEDLFKAMNASRILVAILQEHGPLTVTTETFLNANESDRSLNVEYDDAKLSFIFKLSDNNGN
jgi:hypothetical protein